jgi:hypothetical protein
VSKLKPINTDQMHERFVQIALKSGMPKDFAEEDCPKGFAEAWCVAGPLSRKQFMKKLLNEKLDDDYFNLWMKTHLAKIAKQPSLLEKLLPQSLQVKA